MALLSADGLAPQHRAAMLLGAKCRRCPLYNRGEGPVMGQIRRGAKLAVVGEAPSSRDVEEGAPFVGQHGEIMAGAFAEGGVTKSDCTLTHAILCRPPGGSLIQYLVEFRRQQRKLAPSERLLDPRDACFPRLQMELAANDNVRTVLGMGNEGLRAVAQVYDIPFGSAKAEPGAPRLSTVTKQHGSPVQIVRPDGRDLTVMASLQPSFALHGKPEYMPVVRADLARVAEVSQRGGLTLWREPEFILDPTLDVAINLIDLLRQSKQLVTVDIETDSVSLLTAAVRCVGLGAEINGHEIVGVIPLERMQTRLPWWGAGAMTQVQNALRALLDEAPLNGHNLMFDTAVLICRGLMRRRDKLWADCYRERDTEFLTERGWLAYADVRPTDRLATVRPDGSMEFQHYTDRVSKIHHGVLYQIETHHTRAVVTPRHRMWTRPVKRGAHGATVGAWGFTEMRDLLVQSPDTADMLRACPPAPEADQPNPVVDGIELTPSLLKFLGLAISDGSIRWYKEAPYRLRVSQLEEGRAAPLLKTLHEELQLQRNGPYVKRASATRRVDAREMRWTHPSRELAAAFVRWIGRYSVERRLPPFTLTLPVKHRQALLAGLLVGDASPIGKQITYRSAHKALADDVQALALSLGLPTNVLRASSDCWGAMIQIGQPAVVRARMRTTDVDSNGVVTEIPGEGERIACFVVPNHTLVTRSGGRPAFHGNTLIGHHDTRWSELPHNLGFVAARYFDSPRWKEDADSKVVKGVADYWLHKYCGRDVLNTHRLWPRIAAQIEADGQMGAYSTDIRMAPGLRDMGLLGLNINEQRRQEYFQTFTRAALRHRENVRRIVGNPDFNPSAARQVARFLFDEQGLTPTYASGGVEWEELIQENEDEELDLDLEDLETVVVKASTDETALLALIERGVDAKSREFIDAELSFRAMLKTHTALGLKLEADGSQTDTYRAKGHLHTRSFAGPGLQNLSILNPNWKVHVTPSGRLASSPAVQNIAERVVFDVEQYRSTEGRGGIINLRTIFEAPPGYIYVGADYSQIELRLVAAKAKDALLLEALAKGLDPHALNYATMMAKNASQVMVEYQKVVSAPPKVKKHLRNIAKRLAFLIFYGGHKTKLAKTMKSDRNPDGSLSFPGLKDSDVFFWYDNFHKQHPEILRWQQDTIAYWQANGFVETVLDGRRRYFVGGEDMTAIPNMRIQGSAAAIANRALLLLMRDCPYQGWGELAGPVFQCHDELVLQVPIERTKDAEELIHAHLPWTDPADGMYYAIEQSTRKTLAGG